jgi:hypothetical protein
MSLPCGDRSGLCVRRAYLPYCGDASFGLDETGGSVICPFCSIRVSVAILPVVTTCGYQHLQLFTHLIEVVDGLAIRTSPRSDCAIPFAIRLLATVMAMQVGPQ